MTEWNGKPKLPLKLLRSCKVESVWLDDDGRVWTCPRPAGMPDIGGMYLAANLADLRLMPSGSDDAYEWP